MATIYSADVSMPESLANAASVLDQTDLLDALRKAKFNVTLHRVDNATQEDVDRGLVESKTDLDNLKKQLETLEAGETAPGYDDALSTALKDRRLGDYNEVAELLFGAGEPISLNNARKRYQDMQARYDLLHSNTFKPGFKAFETVYNFDNSDGDIKYGNKIVPRTISLKDTDILSDKRDNIQDVLAMPYSSKKFPGYTYAYTGVTGPDNTYQYAILDKSNPYTQTLKDEFDKTKIGDIVKEAKSAYDKETEAYNTAKAASEEQKKKFKPYYTRLVINALRDVIAKKQKAYDKDYKNASNTLNFAKAVADPFTSNVQITQDNDTASEPTITDLFTKEITFPELMNLSTDLRNYITENDDTASGDFSIYGSTYDDNSPLKFMGTPSIRKVTKDEDARRKQVDDLNRKLIQYYFTLGRQRAENGYRMPTVDDFDIPYTILRELYGDKIPKKLTSEDYKNILNAIGYVPSDAVTEARGAFQVADESFTPYKHLYDNLVELKKADKNYNYYEQQLASVAYALKNGRYKNGKKLSSDDLKALQLEKNRLEGVKEDALKDRNRALVKYISTRTNKDDETLKKYDEIMSKIASTQSNIDSATNNKKALDEEYASVKSDLDSLNESIAERRAAGKPVTKKSLKEQEQLMYKLADLENRGAQSENEIKGYQSALDTLNKDDAVTAYNDILARFPMDSSQISEATNALSQDYNNWQSAAAAYRAAQVNDQRAFLSRLTGPDGVKLLDSTADKRKDIQRLMRNLSIATAGYKSLKDNLDKYNWLMSNGDKANAAAMEKYTLPDEEQLYDMIANSNRLSFPRSAYTDNTSLNILSNIISKLTGELKTKQSDYDNFTKYTSNLASKIHIPGLYKYYNNLESTRKEYEKLAEQVRNDPKNVKLRDDYNKAYDAYQEASELYKTMKTKLIEEDKAKRTAAEAGNGIRLASSLFDQHGTNLGSTRFDIRSIKYNQLMNKAIELDAKASKIIGNPAAEKEASESLKQQAEELNETINSLNEQINSTNDTNEKEKLLKTYNSAKARQDKLLRDAHILVSKSSENEKAKIFKDESDRLRKKAKDYMSAYYEANGLPYTGEVYYDLEQSNLPAIAIMAPKDGGMFTLDNVPAERSIYIQPEMSEEAYNKMLKNRVKLFTNALRSGDFNSLFFKSDFSPNSKGKWTRVQGYSPLLDSNSVLYNETPDEWLDMFNNAEDLDSYITDQATRAVSRKGNRKISKIGMPLTRIQLVDIAKQLVHHTDGPFMNSVRNPNIPIEFFEHLDLPHEMFKYLNAFRALNGLSYNPDVLREDSRTHTRLTRNGETVSKKSKDFDDRSDAEIAKEQMHDTYTTLVNTAEGQSKFNRAALEIERGLRQEPGNNTGAGSYAIDIDNLKDRSGNKVYVSLSDADKTLDTFMQNNKEGSIKDVKSAQRKVSRKIIDGAVNAIIKAATAGTTEGTTTGTTTGTTAGTIAFDADAEDALKEFVKRYPSAKGIFSDVKPEKVQATKRIRELIHQYMQDPVFGKYIQSIVKEGRDLAEQYDTELKTSDIGISLLNALSVIADRSNGNNDVDVSNIAKAVKGDFE